MAFSQQCSVRHLLQYERSKPHVCLVNIYISLLFLTTGLSTLGCPDLKQVDVGWTLLQLVITISQNDVDLNLFVCVLCVYFCKISVMNSTSLHLK